MRAALGITEAAVSQVSERQRHIATWMALALLSGKSHVPKHDNMHQIQHVCLDFSVSGGMVTELLSFASDCPLTAASPATQHALTTQAIYVAERIMAHDDDDVHGESFVRIVNKDGVPEL